MFATALLVAGCSTPAPETETPEQPPYRPVASIREIMNSVIDPNVDPVWNSVKSVVDKGGLADHAPVTDEDWAVIRGHALVVSEAANLLLIPGRPVAPAGEGARDPEVEASPEEIRDLIEKNRDAWNLYAQQFQDSLKPALAAIDAKDPQALVDAGEQIDATCENCHQVFWFPKQ